MPQRLLRPPPPPCLSSHKIEEYLAEVMSMLKELTETLATIKGNVTKTRNILNTWEKKLMFERKDGKVHINSSTYSITYRIDLRVPVELGSRRNA